MVPFSLGERHRCCERYVPDSINSRHADEIFTGLTGKKEGKTRLMNMVMQLRKVTCHPYLFDGAVRVVFSE